MAYLQQKGNRTRFSVINADCLGATCFQPGRYESRGATLGGSRNTGNTSSCCLRNAYHGCPDTPEITAGMKAERKREGWKASS